MRTLIDLLENLSNVSLDRRAALRRGSIAFRSIAYRVDSYSDALNRTRTIGVPSVIVRENGQAVVFDSGVSGEIWVCNDSEALSDSQVEFVRVVQQAFSQLGAVMVAGDQIAHIDQRVTI